MTIDSYESTRSYNVLQRLLINYGLKARENRLPGDGRIYFLDFPFHRSSVQRRRDDAVSEANAAANVSSLYEASAPAVATHC